MKTATIQLYDFAELSQEAKDKALSRYNESNDFPCLEDDLSEYLKNMLDEQGIEYENLKLFYSLSYCQGDGVCFEGDFIFKGVNVGVRHNNGHYYHSNSVDMAVYIDDNGEDDLRTDLIELKTQEVEAEFRGIFREICDEIEKVGYEQIEYEQSEESFKHICEINEYTFEQDGTMRNL